MKEKVKKIWVLVAPDGHILAPSASSASPEQAFRNGAAFVCSTPGWMKRKGYKARKATLKLGQP